MTSKDIRWKQRFVNFERSFVLLEKNIKIVKPSEVEIAGIIHFYEMTFELSWKLMKDYLEEQGFTGLNSPRAVIKQALQSEVIEDGHAWIDALEDRNITAHTYDETKAEEVVTSIHSIYFPLLKALYVFMKKEYGT